jgi:TolB-like protein/Tfp pilus assembly protein PilF
VTDSGKAVFLSYASQDAQAASRISEVLLAAGIEVWFDQSELRGGDAWDQMIRRQIKSCYLFVPIISANTQSREEGYFRREWKLGVDRTIDMAEDRAFLVPIVIDGTSDSEARVPEKFRQVQWTRLPRGETPPEFVKRIEQLLSGEVRPSRPVAQGPAVAASGRPSHGWLAVGVAVSIAAVSAYLFVEKPWVAKPPPAATFAPPAHSIAVLPFANLSGDPNQEYFSDGLTEEILNSLSAIEGLQVAARTSSFSFKEHPDLLTVAHKLNVASVLEGSVRRSEHALRVTAQLIDASSGFHLWSKTYDENSGDVLKLQTEIAAAVAQALKVTLLGDDLLAKIALGGTSNLAAFDAYLRGRKTTARNDAKTEEDAIAAFTEAIRLDPNYGLAFAGRSLSYSNAAAIAPGPAVRGLYDRALADAYQAIALVPNLAPGHSALANYYESTMLDLTQAAEEYERAQSLTRQSCGGCGIFAVLMGRSERGLAELRRGVIVDPLNPRSYDELSLGLYFSRRYSESVDAATHAISLGSKNADPHANRGLAYYGLGDFERARSSCEAKPDYWRSQQCLAVTYEKLGRHAEAEAILAKMKATLGDGAAYQYGEIYAQWGNVPKAIESLDTAMRLRDGALEYLRTDPLMDPMRKEPRFEAIMRELKFPP